MLQYGDYLAITAGVAVFNRSRLIEFAVNGAKVLPNKRGVANYKMKTLKNQAIIQFLFVFVC